MPKKRISIVDSLKELSRSYFAGLALERKKERLFAATEDGQGQPVFVLPGFLMGDDSMLGLRAMLDEKGYKSYGWGQGISRTPTRVIAQALEDKLQRISDTHNGRPVTIIGYSLGGMYARELARKNPDLVKQVITIASPFGADETMNFSLRPLRRLTEIFNAAVQDLTDEYLVERSLSEMPVPTTAIYSKRDGIVYWESAINAVGNDVENVEIRNGHIALLSDPAVRLVLLDRLAQSDDRWLPSEPEQYPDFSRLIKNIDHFREAYPRPNL